MNSQANVFGYLMRLGNTWINCICYNILNDRSGKYAANLMATCQLAAKHTGKIAEANRQKRWRNWLRGHCGNQVRFWINTMMKPMRVMLDWGYCSIRYDEKTYFTDHRPTRTLAIPVLRNNINGNQPRTGTIYAMVRFEGGDACTIIRIKHSDEEDDIYIPEVNHRHDLWKMIKEDYMLDYVNSLFNITWANWTSFLPYRKEIGAPFKIQHTYKRACNDGCHNDEIPDHYEWVVVGETASVLARSSKNRYAAKPNFYDKYDCFEYRSESYNYRWVVNKKGKQTLLN